MIFTWRNMFFGIVIINVAIVLGLFFFIFFSGNDTNELKLTGYGEGINTESTINLTVLTNKKDLTTLINNYLEDEFQEQVLNYKIVLSEKVMLIGSIPAFGKEIDLVMTFEPVPQKNGDLILEQESISLGQIKLPVNFVLHYISENYALPEWITIEPNQHKIHAAITTMELNSNVAVKVESFDLKNDDISFGLMVPVHN
ncbi:YpmS family protein [Litchfieldia alkalitelluris]|uniref:YpmS family protein n=1 Tax=Litchfieldia alkalitelluris TaxID=304268 RepID=UPI00147466CC|nr:YpmS family protein [Litchfieldia alkalitelluris]